MARKVYKVNFYVRKRDLQSTFFDHLPDIRKLIPTFWSWVNTNTLLSASDVTIWSVDVYEEKSYE